MFHRTLKLVAVPFVALVLGCLAPTRPLPAGEWIPVGAGEVCEDPCDEPRPSCCDCLRRKLQLHCVYARRALCCRYIALPYTQPNSSLYYPGPGAAGFGIPNCPMAGPMPAYPYNYGYGSLGYGVQPGYAAMGNASIR